MRRASCSARWRSPIRLWSNPPAAPGPAASRSRSTRGAASVAVEGWARTSEIAALDLALAFEDAGAAVIVHTDIERDGVLGGANVEATAALARRLKTPVIASGGISSEADIAALKAHEQDGISGAIIGRALYDGRIDLVRALALAEGPC